MLEENVTDQEEFNKIQQLTERVLLNVFGAGQDAKKFIAANRIPFICHDIRYIKESLEREKINNKEIHDEIKKNQKENQKELNDKLDRIMYGVLGTIGLYIIGKFLKLL